MTKIAAHKAAAPAAPKGLTAVAGSSVAIHYTGTLEDGSVFDSSVGGSPLQVKLGEGSLIPGFERAVIGMHVGEKKTFTVLAADAYPFDENLVMNMPRAAAPPDLVLEVDKILLLQGPGGERLEARITALTDEGVTLDANPPVAGKDLTFAIELISLVHS